MVSEAGAVVRPVELGHAFKIWLRLSAQHWHRPDADVVAARAISLARPKRDQRAIGRESHGADLWIDEVRHTTAREIVELS